MTGEIWVSSRFHDAVENYYHYNQDGLISREYVKAKVV